MGKRSLFLLVSLWPCFAKAQQPFIKFYDNAPASSGLIELASHNFFGGMERGSSLIDPEGNIIQTNPYWSDSITVQLAVQQHSDNEFYFVSSYRKDSCSSSGSMTIYHWQPAIGKMDSSGNVLELHCYQLNSAGCYGLPENLEITDEGSVIIWGRKTQGIQQTFFALKTDSTGAPIWAKNFTNHGGLAFIKELPGGDLVGGINMDTAGAVVARLDPDGNFLWCKSYFRPYGVIHDVLIESDDAFVVVGYTDSIGPMNGGPPPPPDYHPKLFMMKLNGTGELQWCKGYENTSTPWFVWGGLHVVGTQNGNYVVLANIGTPNTTILPSLTFLMKTDESGDTLWTRSHGVSSFSYWNSGLLASSDGGFLFDGQVYGYMPLSWPGDDAFFVMKTDSLGHMPCFESSYPLDVTELFPTDSSFILTSVDGAVVLTALVSDTTFNPVVAYDGCLFTGIETTESRKFKVYPNPNTGHFTVEFENPLMADSYYAVYDAMGRLVFQHVLPVGAMIEEIDLSRYGWGTYAIKLTDRNGVRYERVVVE